MYYAYTFMNLYIPILHCNHPVCTCIPGHACTREDQICKAGLRSKKTGMYKYIPSTYVVHTKFALVCEQYVIGMYAVHTLGIAMPRAFHCYVAVAATSQSLLQSPPVFPVRTKGISSYNRSLTYLIWQSAASVHTML
jgi:hypothetical protein